MNGLESRDVKFWGSGALEVWSSGVPGSDNLEFWHFGVQQLRKSARLELWRDLGR